MKAYLQNKIKKQKKPVDIVHAKRRLIKNEGSEEHDSADESPSKKMLKPDYVKRPEGILSRTVFYIYLYSVLIYFSLTWQ